LLALQNNFVNRTKVLGDSYKRYFVILTKCLFVTVTNLGCAEARQPTGQAEPQNQLTETGEPD